MKGLGIITLIALLNAGLSNAGDYTATNRIPEQFHQLMDSTGYACNQINFSLPRQNTNSLRQWRISEQRQFLPFVRPPQKSGWNLWNNSDFKYVGNKTDQISLLSPSAALSHYEYDITYSFAF